jgi:hypothetical protein
MSKNALLATSILLAAAGSARANAPARVWHVPPAEATAGEALPLEALVDRAWESTLELRFRPVGVERWAGAQFELGADRYIATVPAETMAPPGIEYFIVGRGADGSASAHFASADAPHRVMVYEDTAAVRVQRELDRVEGRRARVRVAAEWVDYGARKLGPNGELVPDSYYRVDASFMYRLFKFPLYSLRFGYSRLRGDTPLSERGAPCPDPCEVDAGFSAGGWFELRWRLARRAELDTRLMGQATPDGFNFGVRTVARLGDEDGSHVALGYEGIVDVGSAYFFRLGWDTVPALPMAATVELTDFPATHRATGVRLIYDIAHPMDNGLRIGARVGYQARDEGIGGATVGGNVGFEF